MKKDHLAVILFQESAIATNREITHINCLFVALVRKRNQIVSKEKKKHNTQNNHDVSSSCFKTHKTFFHALKKFVLQEDEEKKPMNDGKKEKKGKEEKKKEKEGKKKKKAH